MQARAVMIAFAALAAAPAFAQSLGSVSSVTGVATMTTNTGGTAVVAGAPVVNGARIVTTSTSTVTVSLNNGCKVSVPPAHGVTFSSTMNCQQAMAAVQPVTPVASRPTTTVLGQSSSGGGGGLPVAIWAAAIGIATVADAVDNDGDNPPAVVPPPISGQ